MSDRTKGGRRNGVTVADLQKDETWVENLRAIPEGDCAEPQEQKNVQLFPEILCMATHFQIPLTQGQKHNTLRSDVNMSMTYARSKELGRLVDNPLG